jgi:hypothetical protein
MSRPSPFRTAARVFLAGAALSASVLVAPAAPVHAQGTDAGSGWRIGVSVGGISTVGLIFEAYRDSRSIDVTLGTFGFRDVGLAVSGKQYIGGRAARPYVGLGFWTILASTDPRNGMALIGRVPVGVDWNFHDRHALGAEIGLNRALLLRRPDPTDDRPLNRRLVPLPGIYYRATP